MRISGLDPGESTGFAIIDVTNDNLEVIDYGEIAVTKPGLPALLRAIWTFVGEHRGVIVFEEFIPSQKMRTTKEAAEVRGVIRLRTSFPDCAGSTSYYPATIRSQLGCKNKVEVKAFVERILGMKIRGKDHVHDAMAAAMCHAIKLGIWQPRMDLRGQGDFTLTRKLGGGGGKKIDITGDITDAQAVAMVQSGKARVGRR
jgi:Holliday junction resolvasome RuvABC endonuclease subunit